MLSDAELAFQLLHKLGNEGILKFHTSRILRTTFATEPVTHLLWRVTVYLQEPFRLRARSRLRFIFQHKRLLVPPLQRWLRVSQLRKDFFNSFVHGSMSWSSTVCFFHLIIPKAL